MHARPEAAAPVAATPEVAPVPTLVAPPAWVARVSRVRTAVVRMAYEVTTTGVPAVNVVTRSRVVSGTVISASPAGTRREVRVSRAASEAVGSAGKGRVATTAKVRTTTGKVSATTAASVSAATATATTTVSAATTATTVTLGAGRHRRPGGDRYSGQYTESPDKNSCMFHLHGLHSVAGPR